MRYILPVNCDSSDSNDKYALTQLKVAYLCKIEVIIVNYPISRVLIY